LRIKSVLLSLVIVVSLFAFIVYPLQQSYQQPPLSSKLILSTRHFFDPNTGDKTPLGETHSAAVPNFQLDAANCPDEMALYVHGVWAGEQEALSQYNRLKDSYKEALKDVEPNIQPMPIVLYSWDSDTPIDIAGNGWDIAKGIADHNGRYLANSILNLSTDCDANVDIHIIAHSMGARVVLSALLELNNNNNNFMVKSVHLMGAAIDDEEISKNPDDNQDSTFDDRIVYGDAIENHVEKFYNLFNPQDNRLRWARTPYTYYPSYEWDTALGNLGIDPQVKTIDRPENYTDVNVKDEVPEDTSIDFADADGDGMCDLEEWIYNPFVFPFWFLTCGIHSVGDNHRGYMGFRDHASKLIVDEGVMDIVVRDWLVS
jgi:pimeloyl-ACP methyl ester carboxylesterase